MSRLNGWVPGCRDHDEYIGEPQGYDEYWSRCPECGRFLTPGDDCDYCEYCGYSEDFLNEDEG